MPEPNPSSPRHTDSVEAYQPNMPAEYSGLAKLLRDPDNNTFFIGRIDDVYSNTFSAIVSIPSTKTTFSCVWLSNFLNRLTGGKDISCPPLGSHVLVCIPNDQKFGVILGHVPDYVGIRFSTPNIAIDGNFNSESVKEAHFPKDWQVDAGVLDGNANGAMDVIPGDRVFLNDTGCLIGILKMLSTLKASDKAKIECFLIDDLTRIVGDNLQIFSSLGETRVYNDDQKITLEFNATSNLNESMGRGGVNPGTPGKDYDPRNNTIWRKEQPDPAEGRWRVKTLIGHLGDLVQMFVMNPNPKSSTLPTAGADPDVGLASVNIGRNGQLGTRSINDVSMQKTFAIGTPKKMHQWDDEKGDKGPGEPETELFQWASAQGRAIMSMACEIRDYYGWLYNRYTKGALNSQPLDWVNYDDSQANNNPAVYEPKGRFDPSQEDTPAETSEFKRVPFEVPRLSGYFREAPPVNQGAGWVGQAWVSVLPDGSVSLKDCWGSTVEMRGGHINYTASNDINFIAGRKVVFLAGDDIVLRAKRAVDITSSEGQVRIKAQDQMSVYAHTGGLFFSTGSPGLVKPEAKGEDFFTPGIIFKSGGSIMFSGDRSVFNLDSYLYLNGRDPSEQSKPFFLTDTQAQLHRNARTVQSFGNDDYLDFFAGGVYGTGHLLAEKTIYTRGALYATEPSFAPKFTEGKPDWSKVPYLRQIEGPSFDPALWLLLQGPLSVEQINKAQFSYRSPAEYGTNDPSFEIYEAIWQRELGDELASWKEFSINETYVWPGKKHFEGGGAFVRYTDGNVNFDGTPKPATSMSPRGGDFSGTSFQNFKVHPAS